MLPPLMCQSERCIRSLIHALSARFGVILALHVLAGLGFYMLRGISACIHPMMTTLLPRICVPILSPMIVAVSF